MEGGATMADQRLAGRRIAVVIVSYRTAAMVLTGLPTLVAELASCARRKVVIVDNASPEGDGDRLAAGLAAGAFGEGVALIRSPVNGGFSAGNNLGFAALRALDWTPEAVLLLNPDAAVLPGALAEMLAVMDKQPKAGVVGARLRNPDGSTWSAAFNFPGAFSEFAAATGLGVLQRRRPNVVEHAASARVDWVSGAAMMVRWQALAALGDMDEGYFLYFEEVDFMLRARRLGWETWTAPAALIAHDAGSATGIVDGRSRSGPMPDYWFASWRRYFTKNHGPAYARIAAAAKTAGLLIGAAQRGLRGRPDPHTPGFPRDFVRKALLAPLDVARSGQDARVSLPRGATNANPPGIGFWALVREDFETNDRDLFSQGLWALVWHRFGNWRMGVRPRILRPPLTIIYRVMAKLSEWVGGIFLPYTVRVGRRVRLDHFGGMILVAESIGDDVVIRQNTTFGIARVSDPHARPTIGSRVDIGAGAVIVGAIAIGDDAVIGANAVVTKSVPPGAVAAGVPARIIRQAAPDARASAAE